MKRRYLYLKRVPYFHMIHPGKQLHIINFAAEDNRIFYILPCGEKKRATKDGPANIIDFN